MLFSLITTSLNAGSNPSWMIRLLIALRFAKRLTLSVFVVCCCSHFCIAENRVVDPNVLDSATLSVIKTYCRDCHGGKTKEGDIDFDTLDTIEHARDNIDLWLKVRQVLGSRQMPPRDAPQPSDAELKQLQTWTRAFLAAEAIAKSGDPGPVVLRRLSNAEYSYAISDITQLKTLAPARELPVDGAAGEGFTNVGSGQAMSPALLRKYLDSAKRIADHLMLLPNGIEFTESITQRDRTNDLLAEIQNFYRSYTADGGGAAVNLQGIKFETNQGGLLPIKSYLQATLDRQHALRSGTQSIEQVASQYGLNPRYLGILWHSLTNEDTDSFLIKSLQAEWRRAATTDVDLLVSKVKQAQDGLWKFNSIGHIGRQGGPKQWMESVTPVLDQQELRLPLVASGDGSDIRVILAAHDLGDGDQHDFVVWQKPRLLFKPDSSGVQPPILLRDLRNVVGNVELLQKQQATKTSQYLDALLQLHLGKLTLDEVADAQALNRDLLACWSAVTGLGQSHTREIKGLFVNRLTKAQGYDAINGWGVSGTPSLLTNRSREAISFLTLTIPQRSVVVHPSPTSAACVGWKSPLNGTIKLDALVADADNKCGNGAGWIIEHRTRRGQNVIAKGMIDNGGRQDWIGEQAITVAVDDVVVLMIHSRDENHGCDTTHVELKLTETEGLQRSWDLSENIVDRIQEGNPLADTLGNPGVWTFFESASEPESAIALAADSALARWSELVLSRDSPAIGSERTDLQELSVLAATVQQAVITDNPQGLTAGDRAMRTLLLDWRGPLRWLAISQSAVSPDSTRGAEQGNTSDDADSQQPDFGVHPDGGSLDTADLCSQGSHRIEFQIPDELAAAELVTTARMHSASGIEGTAQVQIHFGSVDTPEFDFGGTVLVHAAGKVSGTIKSSMASFGQLFPPALCYARIVPVDEVVTLTLFHREDEHLRRLMLDEQEARELDQLWDELLFVSDEPLKLAVSFEQISEFATQDRPDLVTAFEPLRGPINRRALDFRQRKSSVEPVHVRSVVMLAELSWRRRLDEDSQQQLIGFYRRLRDEGMFHAEALRLLLARVLTSPEFLYKLETPGTGAGQSEVDGQELASRLSFFLWSSIPDTELLESGRDSRLQSDPVLIQQVNRMLRDDRVKRMAVQFACQWLHLRDFDTNDDKNESLYPEFAALRGSMYGETVRFFEDMFQNNRSILDLIDADHTFVDQSLADHYGIKLSLDNRVDVDLVTEEKWQRIEGIRASGRGGVLGMATFLASQSGASRTSPILRGNWIYETLLGEHLPRPPANVPLLPEELPSGLTARQMIEKHSSVAACAKCHSHIDPLGFALESYDALGRQRPETTDTRATLLNGRVIDGVSGLRRYLIEDRRDDVVRQFCRKLLGFSLGRQVLLSDEPLLNQMRLALKANGYRFNTAVEQIVTSPQFRQIRNQQNTVQP